MRVLVLSTVFPSPRQPLHGLFVAKRIQYLARLADVRVVAPVPWPRWRSGAVLGRETLPDLTVYRPLFFYIPGLFKFLDGLFLFLSVAACVRRVKRDFDFDLIDAHFAFPEGFAAVLLSRWLRRPVTITLRGTLITLSVYRLRRWLMGWTLRRATRVIAVARNLADYANVLGVPSHKIEEIGNGVDTAQFAPTDRDHARRSLGIPTAGKLIVSVGHLSLRKGFQRLLRVLPQMREEFPDLTLAILGGPGAERSNEEELLQLIADGDLAQSVILAGAQPPAQVALWLGAANVFALASDFEGSPNVVLEALACGLPVVATRVGSVEQLVPEFAGLLYDDPDNLDQLTARLTEALRRDWDYARIRSHAECNTWDTVAVKVLRQWRLAAGALATENPRTSGNKEGSNP